MRQLPSEQLKDLLISEGLVTEEDFDLASREALRLKQDSVSVLVAQGKITLDYFYALLAKFYGVSLANLSNRKLDEDILRLLPEDIAHDKRAIVFLKDERGSYYVALEDPSDLQILDFLKQYLKSDVVPFLATDDDLNLGFKIYGQKLTEDFKGIIEKNIQESLKSKPASVSEAAADLPIVLIVDTLLSYAVTSRASDIHLEVMETEFVVRFRIDGILHEIIKVPKEVHAAIVARIKILANLKLDEHFKPQDGRFRAKSGDGPIDARVSVMPTLYGEKVVMRILPANQKLLSFEEIGMLPDTVKIIYDNLKKTYGMILVTGPTGSGKTTTLYTMINILNRSEVNIATIEDPIEFGIPNVNQTQINPLAGLDFADGLRALVRQDPNVIMVGEIRDKDTAEISVHSALTGSLVLSTLHTNNAATAVPRLLDMGIPPFLVAAVLNLVLAQRLVRRICLDCIVSYKPDVNVSESIKSQMKVLGFSDDAIKPPKLLYKGKGCDACGGIGYKGRVGIYEALRVTEDIQKIIVAPDFTLESLEAVARKDGMVTMFQDGLRKAERGLTTIEEVLRVIRE